MQLEIIIGEHSMQLEVPDEYLEKSTDSFDKLDATMDKGCRLGARFIKKPDITHRCQYAANKLLSAIETHNEGLAMVSAGYIITRKPGVQGVRIDNNGEPEETQFL